MGVGGCCSAHPIDNSIQMIVILHIIRNEAGGLRSLCVFLHRHLDANLPASKIQTSSPIFRFHHYHRLNSNEANDLSKSKKTRTVGKSIVSSSRAGVTALVKELKVARVNGEGLVVGRPDQVTVADVVGPGGAAVGLAGERSRLLASLDSPLAIEAGGGERAEVTSAGALGLDDHEVLALAVGVD